MCPLTKWRPLTACLHTSSVNVGAELKPIPHMNGREWRSMQDASSIFLFRYHASRSSKRRPFSSSERQSPSPTQYLQTPSCQAFGVCYFQRRPVTEGILFAASILSLPGLHLFYCVLCQVQILEIPRVLVVFDSPPFV